MPSTYGLHIALRRFPDCPATVYQGQRRSFREFGERVARFAGALRALGVANDAAVGVLALNSDRYFECFFGTLWANARLRVVDGRSGPARIAGTLRSSGVRVLVVDDFFAPAVPGLLDLGVDLDHLIYCGDGPVASGSLHYERLIEDCAPVPDVTGTGYTTLGRTIRGAVDRRFLHATPVIGATGVARWAARALPRGTNFVLPHFESTMVLTSVDAHRITDLVLYAEEIAAVLAHPLFGSFDLSCLRRVVSCGPPVPGLDSQLRLLLPYVELQTPGSSATLGRRIEASAGVEVDERVGCHQAAGAVRFDAGGLQPVPMRTRTFSRFWSA